MVNVHTYNFDIKMSCGGCRSTVERALKELQDVESFEVSVEDQTAKVRTNLSYDVVLEKLNKTGKRIESATADGVRMPVNAITPTSST